MYQYFLHCMHCLHIYWHVFLHLLRASSVLQLLEATASVLAQILSNNGYEKPTTCSKKQVRKPAPKKLRKSAPKILPNNLKNIFFCFFLFAHPLNYYDA